MFDAENIFLIDESNDKNIWGWDPPFYIMNALRIFLRVIFGIFRQSVRQSVSRTFLRISKVYVCDVIVYLFLHHLAL